MPRILNQWKCQVFGHKWVPVYIVERRGAYKFIATYCQRCCFGHDDLVKFVSLMDVINTYEKRYYGIETK